MCGIFGYASKHSPANGGLLARASDAMRHRGPDDCGEWRSPDGFVGLSHRRLAIIDLSPGGHQPMSDVSGALTITFNGEVYNYRELKSELVGRGHSFRTSSDTEVLLVAYREWGEDCLSRVNGMFAFALYDAARRRLFLARDRAGEKPLFYHRTPDGLQFASELKALMASPALPRRIDREALDCYLAMGYIPGDRCILEGCRKLPPAHAMSFDLETGAERIWRYWALPEYLETEASETGLLDELEALLEGAVGLQLTADVPVGILLSGGVDSSLITAMAVRTSPKVLTFTVRFPGFGTHDETEHARLIARHFATNHVELEASPTSVDLLPSLARQFDEPMVDSSMIPTYLVSRLVREHCTVALGGDGGDELFGGYTHYSRLLRLERMTKRVPRAVRHATARVGTALLPTGTKGRNWVDAAGSDFRHTVAPVQWIFDRRDRMRLMAGHAWAPFAESVHAARLPATGDLLQRATRMDFENYLAEDILVKVDRATMLTSLEMRAPFLDRSVIEFAFGKVPTRLKASPAGLKLLLKKLCQRVLPPAFDRQRKQGFSIPIAHWLKQDSWASLISDTLLATDAIFDQAAVRALLDGQRRGRDNGERLFGLVLFELWRREYGATL